MSATKIDPKVKLALELGPVLLFFIGFKFFKDRTFQIWGTDYSGLVAMTALLVVLIMVSSAIMWRLTGKLSKMQMMTLVLVIVMGTLGVWGGWTYATDTPLGRSPPEQKDVLLLYGIEWPVAKQYHGNPESFFFKHLAKPFVVGPHVPLIPMPPGMWLGPGEENAPRGYPEDVQPSP